MIDDTYLGWTEVADRCFVHRFPYLDVSSTVIVGAQAAMVVDTLASARQGELLAEQVRTLTDRPVRVVANTHVHFDHLFGNGAFAAPIVAHESVPADLPGHTRSVKALYAHLSQPRGETDDPNREDALATEPVAPTVTFEHNWQIDLGDRPVEVAFLGRGHTRGDIVVVVPDADVVCAGDLVEESAPPSFGSDCHPLAWPHTLTRLIARLHAETVVVPGHGRVVDREFVQAQQADVARVADRIQQLAADGGDPAAALAAGGWPWPPAHVAEAVRRGLAEITRAQR